MSERLTDDQITALMCACEDSKKNEMAVLGVALAELKERRAADLTKFSADAVAVCNDDGKARRVYLSGREMEALGTLFAFVYREVAMTQAECDALKPGLDVLSKLTKAGR